MSAQAHAQAPQRRPRDPAADALTSVESLARRRRLGVTRMPVAFLNLERNRQYWPRKPYPAPATR